VNSLDLSSWVRHGWLLLLVFTVTVPAFAWLPSADRSISPAAQAAVIDSLVSRLQSDYVYPAAVTGIASGLKKKLHAGDYAKDLSAEAFADRLGRDLRDLGNDLHLRVSYDPAFQAPVDDGAPVVATRADLDEERDWVASKAAGIAAVRHLPGNIGYIDLREFMPADFVGQYYASAMTLVSGSTGLIIDLRQNIGGDPHAVALLLSYFFAENDGRHLNDIYWRKDGTTDQFWTVPVAGSRFLGPVYVLTSARTFSGGEECAYDFQTQKRATIVGAVTGGGANPGGPQILVDGFVAGVPAGRAINPVTKTNWEHVGVKPDVPASPADAFHVAYKALLEKAFSTTKDGEQRRQLEKALSLLQSGRGEVPDYKPVNAH